MKCGGATTASVAGSTRPSRAPQRIEAALSSTSENPAATLAHARRLVQKWAPRLGLTDWTFTVKWIPPADDSEADGEVDAHEYFNKADVRISKRALKWPAARLEHIIVHELVHVVLRDVKETTEQAVEKGRDDGVTERAREQATERLTCAIRRVRPPTW